MSKCECAAAIHTPRLAVLTGGPGAGKTAVLEVIRRHFCEHVAVLPEAASIVFGGGFPRRDSFEARRAGQRAIFAVQRELERMAIGEAKAAVVLCDRGTLDGLAYWFGAHDELLSSMHTSLSEELARYDAVIHLRTPAADAGYDHSNPLRVETAVEAAAIDARIAAAWSSHPRRSFVEPAADFLTKLGQAVALVREIVPACCRVHRIPGVLDAVV
jgi:predicted ATPase